MSNGSGGVKWSAGATILAALIAATAAIVVGYWQHGQKSKETKVFRGRVLDEQTGKVIRQAKIILEAKGSPDIVYSDSEGFFSFLLEEVDTPVRIRVEANNYEKYDRFVTPTSISGIEEIRVQSSLNSAQTIPPPKFPLELSSEQIEALQNGSQVIIESRRNVDDRVLYSIFAGKALDAQRTFIQGLKEDKQYAIWTLYEQKINQPIEVKSSTSKVSQVITWSATIYSSVTKQCIGQFTKYESPQIVILIKEEISNQWKINDVFFEKGSPTLKGCN